MARTNLSPEQRSQSARLAALSRWAKQDPKEGTAKARRAFLASFEDQVDPDRTLSEAERQRRASAACKAHMTRMALRSSQARAGRS